MNIYSITIFLFMVILAVVGIMISRGIKNSEDWMVAGKSLGWLPMAGTYFATIVSATSIISYMGYYYLNGWSGWWNAAGTLLTSFLACMIFARKLRETECDTLPEYISKRYGKWFSIISSMMIVVCVIALLTNQLIASINILQSFLNWPTLACAIIMMIIFGVFTCIGGMKSVAWTDTICAMIIIVGVWVVAIQFLFKVGGVGAMNAGIAAVNPEFVKGFTSSITPVTALSWILTWGICNFGAPQFIARFFSAESPEVAQKSQGITGIALLVFYVPLIVIGLCGILLVPGIEKQDQVFTTLILNETSPLFGAIMFAAVMAAIISTADSLLLLAATTFTHDVLKQAKPEMSSESELKLSRISTVVFSILGIVFMYFMTDTIQGINAKAVTLMGSALALVVMAGVTWKRVNVISATITAICGFATAMVWYQLGTPGGIMAALPAVVVGLIVLVISTYLTPKNAYKKADPEMMERIFGKE